MKPIDLKLMGQRLRILMDTYNESTYSLSEKLGLSPPTISRYTHGTNKPKMTTIYAIADYFDVNPEWLMGESSNYFREEPLEEMAEENYSKLTVFKRIEYDLALLDNERSDIDLSLPFEIVNGWGPSIALIIEDDAMKPYLKKGDLAVIELNPRLVSQKFAALHINNSHLIIRKIIVDNKRVVVQPSNLDYDADVYSINDIQVIGNVVYSKTESQYFYTPEKQILYDR